MVEAHRPAPDAARHPQERRAFHYVPLHSSPAGQKYGRFFGEDVYTTRESNRLLRLPMYYGMDEGAIEEVLKAIHSFYRV